MEVSTFLTWDYCPEELLWMIFRKLNYKSLLSCMAVNRRWKCIVLDYIEFYCLWPRIFEVTIPNRGRTFKRKSTLSLKDMLMNSMLYSSAHLAEITLQNTYEIQKITCIHVYKDKLILTTNSEQDKPIKYFNITNSELIKSIDGAVKTTEFRENDFMFVYFGPVFRAYGKVSPDDTKHDETRMIGYGIDNILLYKLEDNVCYIFINSFYITFALTWDTKKWSLVSRGRYYGNDFDTVCGMNVFNDRVCLVTKLGFILCENLETKTFHKVNSSSLVPSVRGTTFLKLFNQNSVAVSGPERNTEINRSAVSRKIIKNKNKIRDLFRRNMSQNKAPIVSRLAGLKKKYNISIVLTYCVNTEKDIVRENNIQRVTFCVEERTKFSWLYCEGLTCLTEHGPVLFLGFKDGTVSVYISPIEPAAQGKQDRLFKVQDLDSSIENFAIRKVEVFEDYRSHHLLVVTEDKVLQVLITYPEQVTACYD